MAEKHCDAGETGGEEFEGAWYADRFRVGHNAFQFKVDCGHVDPANEVSAVYFRFITNPFNARELFKLLGVGLLQYADVWVIDENGAPQTKTRSGP